MTTLPAVVPSGYAGDYTDFLKAPGRRDGGVFMKYETVTVPDSTSAATIIGLIPFQKGFKLVHDATKLHTADLDTTTNVTLNIGYTYYDSATIGSASDADAFASALSGQAAGLLTFDEEEGLSWEAAGDGWLTVTLAAGPTTTEGAIKGQITGTYG